jgi:hypothetical protein
MASRKNLLKIDYHDDDDTGIYSMGQIDFGISSLLPEYISQYGKKGAYEILAQLAYLSGEVIAEMDRQSHNKNFLQ